MRKFKIFVEDMNPGQAAAAQKRAGVQEAVEEPDSLGKPQV